VLLFFLLEPPFKARDPGVEETASTPDPKIDPKRCVAAQCVGCETPNNNQQANVSVKG